MARWITADAFEHLGRPDSAVTYFRMLAGPVHVFWGDLLSLGIPYSFANFRLARLYTQLEDYDRAKEHYVTFLETFTQSDPEYEWMVTEAQAALEELARGR